MGDDALARSAARVRAASGAGVEADALAAVDAALDPVVAAVRGADLATVFIGSDHASRAGEIAGRVHERLAPRHLLGVTASGVVADGAELERFDAVSVWAAALPGATLTPIRYEPPPAPASAAAGLTGEAAPPAPAQWREPPPDAKALLLLADPFSFPADAFLLWMERVAPGLPVTGGLASGGRTPGTNRLLLDDRVADGGAVGVAIGGDVAVHSVVSQGCRPIGHSYVVTQAERNVVEELGGARPVERVRETFAAAGRADRELLRRGLHIGLVIDEYRDEFGPGDFLVRGVLGAQAGTDALVIGDVVRVGQTVQFHVRDADSADADLRALLDGLRRETADPAGALLFTCNGRGRHLFGTADHDATAVRLSLGDIPLAGLFCAGEFGPVGARSFLHGFTASLLVLGQPAGAG